MLLKQLRSTGQSAGQSADGDDAVEMLSWHQPAETSCSRLTLRHYNHESF